MARLMMGTCVLAAILFIFFLGSDTPSAAAQNQPIAFSHRLHGGRLKLDCQFCHFYASRSSSAGVPSVRHCMRCHDQVESKSPEVQKLREQWEKRESISWTRIYDLPDHVVFSHQKHVQAEVACAHCHGKVENMETVVRLQDEFTMGWCIQCHREKSASLECLSCHL